MKICCFIICYKLNPFELVRLSSFITCSSELHFGHQTHKSTACLHLFLRLHLPTLDRLPYLFLLPADPPVLGFGPLLKLHLPHSPGLVSSSQHFACIFLTLCSKIRWLASLLPFPLAPQPPQSGPCPSIQGLQLADEFIRPRALPRSITLFRPNQEDIRGPLVVIGHRPWSLEAGQKSPTMSHMSIFMLCVHSWSGRLLFCTLAIWFWACFSPETSLGRARGVAVSRGPYKQ